VDILDNREARRYELSVGEQVAFIDYMSAGKNRIVLTHTEVPEALEGQGIGSRLVKAALVDIRHREMKLIPMCPFVAAYIKRHPEYRDLVFGYRPRES
jgi:predicted GNAT family acetyltransferase